MLIREIPEVIAEKMIFSNFAKRNFMGAIVIRTDKHNTRILREIAKKFGANVLNINEEQFEDISLGILMDELKTGENVSRDSIMKKLHKK